ncbi:MAG: PD-(D/E)XK nuclease family transposase [Proteobacteria bacterium]|nr:PD-(D/E)XK nuclease family transposase [Pseudomonadota bacterium]
MDVSVLREKICNLTLFDDELMTLAFHNQCELTQILLDAICPECEFKVTQVTAQQALYNVMGRSLKLDILANDAHGRTVNIEVQQLPQGAAPVRARFHASLLDVHLLNKGQSFEDLPTVYIIFITKTDVLGGGLPVYTISRRVSETQNDFDDRTIFIYVNGEIMNDTPLGKIMHDFQCKLPHEMRSKPFADRLKELKGFEEKGGKKMGALYDYIYEEGREEGLEKGREEGRFQTYAKIIYKHILKHECSVNEAMELFEVPQNDAAGVLTLVNEEMNKQFVAKQQESQYAVHAMRLQSQAMNLQKYIQKTGCTLDEAFDFFEIPEGDRKPMAQWIKV